mgnify:CR=1 FL=1
MDDLEYLKHAETIVNEITKDLKAANDQTLDRVCPYCGVKHMGPFQACSACKGAVDSGDSESYVGYRDFYHYRRD